MTILFVFMLAWINTTSAQTPTPSPPTSVPRIIGYQGIIHPIVTWNKNQTETNFSDYYVVGFPMGLNLWKTKNIGFSVEMIPFIRAQNGTSRVANVLFHPAMLFNLGHHFTFASRLAFETSGRYGLTPAFSKIIKKGSHNSLFVAVPLPIRFGNDQPVSLGAGLQFSITF
jgi:hypothetical protein